ncbi:MAG TPA: TAT-variant-translocated molybdopterin oxidoreductase [Candidatus Acidoferrales bacterium]|nr:TAT-variant-translocated molybdopterin oxidoreductase [Candidatus Acidoferrales bacterium]
MSMDDRQNEPVDFGEIRARAAAQEKHFWRGLEDLAGTPEARAFLENEFPYEPQKRSGIRRRDILKYMAASAALAGLSACTKLPTEKIVPYVRRPEDIVPGKPLFYATSMPLGGEGIGLLVESHMGRPTKVEGNPEHPGSLGGTDIFTQASILGLYDPDRSQTVMHDGQISEWASFVAAISNARLDWQTSKGAGMRLLTETVISPTLAGQIRAFRVQFPAAKWHQYEPCGRDSAREGARIAFGQYVNTIYNISRADVIVSLDANFLGVGPGHVRYAREFAARRSPDSPNGPMNRLYVIESTPTITGAMADHRLPIRSGDVEALSRALAASVGASSGASAKLSSAHQSAGRLSNAVKEWVAALARDLTTHRGACLVIAGEQQPPAVHALAHAMNAALGNQGKTVFYTDPLEDEPTNELESMRGLVNDINAGKVATLIVLGANPAYTAPADFDFIHAYLKVPQRVHTGLYYDETAELSQWHVPEAHFLEAWGETRAYDGTIGIIQPLIAPLYQGKSAYEVLAALNGRAGQSGHSVVRNYWRGHLPPHSAGQEFEDWWEKTLNDGVMAGTALAEKQVTANVTLSNESATHSADNVSAAHSAESLEIVFRPDPTVGDGRFANNGWLQELPKPITHLTWDNAAMFSPATAQRLNLQNGDYVNLNLDGWKLGAPVWIVPGNADESVTLHLGYGRSKAGRIGTFTGVNAYDLRNSHEPWIARGLQIQKTDQKYWLATTQHHHLIENNGEQIEEESAQAFARDLVQVATLDEFRKNPGFARGGGENTENTNALSLYPGYAYTGYAWGMAIDLNRCIGCNACVVACQSENNIAVVGKEQVLRGREMQWIRVDTYFRGEIDNPEMYVEPVPCMQCENAPCEVVCPVGATNHSPEGLNVMVYNRCVGTRYCSNNCPYKVRRFNFLLYSDWTTQSLYGMRNPDVTVRSRGVMEKCTYCVQRINAVKIKSEEQNRLVRDGEIVTACQQACPAQAIVFGNINDKSSRVAQWKAEPRNYTLLASLNTRPRTTYLAKLRNPNPNMPQGVPEVPATDAD